MLRLKDIRFTLPDYELAADITIQSGICTAVIGPSGSGKSTLLNLIAGFLQASRGQVIWKGADWSNLPPNKRDASILFQDNNLFPHLTILQNTGLAFGAGLRLSPSQIARAKIVLERVGLAGFEHRKPAALSGGQQSRAALARVLLQDRAVVLLDEPFAALGPKLKAEMLDLVRDLLGQSDTTILMVSHDPADAKRIAKQVVLVADGIAENPVATAPFFANPSKALKDYIL